MNRPGLDRFARRKAESDNQDYKFYDLGNYAYGERSDIKTVKNVGLAPTKSE